MKRRGFTLIELLVVVAIIALLIAILLPSLGKARELSNRSVCAANIRGIGQSMAVYAADAADAYPVIAKTGGYGTALIGTTAGSQNASVDVAVTSMYAATSGNVAQNMWLLVMTGQVASKQFLCKSDPANTVTANASVGGQYQVQFNDGTTTKSDLAYSYSFAYPWTVGGTASIGAWWRNKTDAGLPLLSDMAPLGGPTGNNTTTITPNLKTANSFNHQRDGQNVGYGDAHAEFSRRPDVGQSNDNIFTGGTPAGTPDDNGTAFSGGSPPPIATGGAQGAFDVCLVPVADASNSYTRK